MAGRDTSKEIPVSASIGNDPDLGSLVTVNTFSQPEKQGRLDCSNLTEVHLYGYSSLIFMT